MANLPGPAGLAHEPEALAESIWRAPLVPAALAFTAGIVLDRLFTIPFLFSLLLGGGCIAAFLTTRLGGPARLGLVYLFLAGVALGLAYHHYRRDLYRDDDIGHLAGETPQPIRFRGVLDDEPKRMPGTPFQPLRSQPMPPTTVTVVSVTHLIEAGGRERPVSGRVRLRVTGEGRLLPDLHPGDEVEVRGRMVRLASRSNPGEFDQAAYWHERGIHAHVDARQGNAGIKPLAVGWPWSLQGWLGLIRGGAHDLLDRALEGRSTAGLARALLLGEGAPMSQEEWSKYIRTGVVHVLAISGQHLVVVACFLWAAARLFGVRQRHAALFIALVLLGYALVTGGRPPALRAAVGACMLCLGLVIGRPVVPANLFALAWLVVAVVAPGDISEGGCQLSFLSVAVLAYATGWLVSRDEDPLEQVIDQSRPAWLRRLRGLGRGMYESYAVCFIVWIAITPLAAFHYGTLAPAALLLGPPLTLLTSIALLAGFVLLAVAGWSSWLAFFPAWIVHHSLNACEVLVDLAEVYPMHVWIGSQPTWLVAIFCAALLAFLTQPPLRQRWRWAVPGGLGWLCLVLLLGAAPRLQQEEFRCTFLAVGHGGAIVMELPDGRTVLYDAGSLRGPDVAKGAIAPYLWARKIHRIDDVILSHADLDHFNGLAGLVERFAIGRVLTSPTFADKQNAAVNYTLDLLSRRGIPHEMISAGDELSASGVTLRALHPPSYFKEGTQNAQSVVLEVRHGEHALLLTGDLEAEGLSLFLRLPPRKVDVLMAPHHGSHRVDGSALVRWCRPRLVVSCQGPPRSMGKAEAMYRQAGVEFWTTQTQGAITVRSGPDGLVVETFRDGQRWRPGP
jgi:competence protein ComEC